MNLTILTGQGNISQPLTHTYACSVIQNETFLFNGFPEMKFVNMLLHSCQYFCDLILTCSDWILTKSFQMAHIRVRENCRSEPPRLLGFGFFVHYKFENIWYEPGRNLTRNSFYSSFGPSSITRCSQIYSGQRIQTLEACRADFYNFLSPYSHIVVENLFQLGLVRKGAEPISEKSIHLADRL